MQNIIDIDLNTRREIPYLRSPIVARIRKITNQGSDNGKYNKSLKESRERGFNKFIEICLEMHTIAKLTNLAKQVSSTNENNKS